ncbi:hypothetical protein NQD34_006273, partial [Periophthalmus magnuspinnatus]
KIKMIRGLLCFALVFKAVYTTPVRKTGRMEPIAAPQEQVNVLMFGVIQFSESLNYAYESTEKKMAKIIQTLKSHDLTLQQLEAQTQKAAEEEKQIKAMITLLQVRKHA